MTNTPGAVTEATAEIALLLAAARRAGEGERLVRSGQWTGWRPTQLLGQGLGGRRLGIFGMGRIGQAVARRARAFDMEIHYSNRNRLPRDQAEGALWHESPEEMLGQIDFLSLHAPATPATQGWLNARRIALLRDGAIVVNTARGGLIDDAALIDALRSGKLAAAGLDVYAGEPDLHPGYRQLDTVFLLPHLGTATLDARTGMGFRALDNLAAFFAGKAVPDAL